MRYADICRRCHTEQELSADKFINIFIFIRTCHDYGLSNSLIKYARNAALGQLNLFELQFLPHEHAHTHTQHSTALYWLIFWDCETAVLFGTNICSNANASSSRRPARKVSSHANYFFSPALCSPTAPHFPYIPISLGPRRNILVISFIMSSIISRKVAGCCSDDGNW